MTKTLIKDRVYTILEKYPETRNCDATLVEIYWEIYHSEELINLLMDDNSKLVSLPLKSLKHVTWPSTIERWRRHIQNKDGRFWPTDPAVASRRRMSMKEWKERMIAAIPDTL